MTDLSLAQPEAPIPVVIDASQPADGVLLSLPLDSIDPSPFNPRGAMDEADLQGLAASIRESGLQQPLVVRAAGAERYELIFGHRRLAALKLNGADRAPCIVRSIGDVGTVRALQIIENLQRADISPLEEAEAFVSLQAEDPERWTAAAIAKAIGKTDRFVSQRLAIARGLAEPLKKRLAKGELPLEVARTLAPLPTSLQASLKKHWSLERDNVDIDDVRRGIFEFAVPVENATFDPQLYDGEILAEGKRKFFTDLDKFRALQTVEAEKVLTKVKKEWPDAKLVTAEHARKLHWADQSWPGYGGVASNSDDRKVRASRYLVPREKCTAIVWVAMDGRIRQAEGVCSEAALNAKRQAQTQRDAAASRERNKPEPKAHKEARLDFIARIAKGLAGDDAMLRRLELLHLLTSGLHAAGLEYGLSDKLLESALPKSLAGVADIDDDDDLSEVRAAWLALCELKPAQIDTIIAQIVAGSVGWSDWRWKKPPPFALVIGASLGIEPALPEESKAAAKPKAKPKAKAKKKGAAK